MTGLTDCKKDWTKACVAWPSLVGAARNRCDENSALFFLPRRSQHIYCQSVLYISCSGPKGGCRSSSSFEAPFIVCERGVTFGRYSVFSLWIHGKKDRGFAARRLIIRPQKEKKRASGIFTWWRLLLYPECVGVVLGSSNQTPCFFVLHQLFLPPAFPRETGSHRSIIFMDFAPEFTSNTMALPPAFVHVWASLSLCHAHLISYNFDNILNIPCWYKVNSASSFCPKIISTAAPNSSPESGPCAANIRQRGTGSTPLSLSRFFLPFCVRLTLTLTLRVTPRRTPLLYTTEEAQPYQQRGPCWWCETPK